MYSFTVTNCYTWSLVVGMGYTSIYKQTYNLLRAYLDPSRFKSNASNYKEGLLKPPS